MKLGRNLLCLFAVFLLICVTYVRSSRDNTKHFRGRAVSRCLRKSSSFRTYSTRDEQNRRILRGADSSAGQYPFMVGVWLNGSPNCGGALLSNRWVLTAAHCVKPYKVKSLDMRIGTTLATDGEGVKVLVSQAIPHEKFSMDKEAYDIALLKAAEPIMYNDNVQPILMAPPGYEVPVGTKVTAIGWGMTKANDKSSYPTVLQFAEIPITSQEACRKAYPTKEILQNMLCAGYIEGKIDACVGDSGGPLVFNDTLVGVVSFGEDCGLPAVPGVYTKVSAFRSWIKKHSGL